MWQFWWDWFVFFFLVNFEFLEILLCHWVIWMVERFKIQYEVQLLLEEFVLCLSVKFMEIFLWMFFNSQWDICGASTCVITIANQKWTLHRILFPVRPMSSLNGRVLRYYVNILFIVLLQWCCRRARTTRATRLSCWRWISTMTNWDLLPRNYSSPTQQRIITWINPQRQESLLR